MVAARIGITLCVKEHQKSHDALEILRVICRHQWFGLCQRHSDVRGMWGAQICFFAPYLLTI